MPPPSPVQGKTVIVTGASAGVGRALAIAFARSGARVGLIARDAAALAETRREIESSGGTAASAAADVADADAILEAAEQFSTDLGPIDIWINNAMATVFSPVADMQPNEFKRVTEVTYLGYVYGTLAALRHMRRRDSGQIIQIGSALAYRGIPLQSAYCGAKHAIRGFTDSLRCELIREGSRIRLTMIQLPAVNTPQFDWARTHRKHQPRPVPPIFQPEAIAQAVLSSVGGGRREYWLGLSSVTVILGSFAVPGFLDRYLARNAYEAQDRTEPVSPDRPDNLMRPVGSIHSVRGSFSDQARSSVVAMSPWAARFGASALCILPVVGCLALILWLAG